MEKPLCWPQNLNPIAPRPDDLDSQFTESEVAVAEQLILLSESSGPTGSANSMASASSSTRSVNTQAWAPLDYVAEDDGGLWRRIKRYRPIDDVYASTVQLGGDGGGKKEITRKRKC
ncbi:hypothetical protein FCM35_KLT11093 [Carex littledalei]|uniref:Uncharacterized protein n=1 Tax=Carex littledalei TaxID=544730 RepID=A0A833QTF6_9POAL|nr:hypothetical protein FCM35_KLT11093 [Carex littledalei]